MVSDTEMSKAQSIASLGMYYFRNLLVGVPPSIKLLAAKAMLSAIRVMVEDLSEGI